jgi:hypothetical protein
MMCGAVEASGIGVLDTAASAGVGGSRDVGEGLRAPQAATTAKQVMRVTRVVLDILFFRYQ